MNRLIELFKLTDYRPAPEGMEELSIKAAKWVIFEANSQELLFRMVAECWLSAR